MSPHQLNSPWPGISRLFPARESLVSDIPARKMGKSVTFFAVYVFLSSLHLLVLFRAAFVFDEGNNLGVSGKGQDFATFKSFFNPDNRGFGYIKVQVGYPRCFKTSTTLTTLALATWGSMQVESRESAFSTQTAEALAAGVEVQAESQHFAIFKCFFNPELPML
jgi:hypothetical protein